MSAADHFWETLFVGAGPAAGTVPMRLARKHGHPFLLLPENSTLSRQVLELYPAQTWRARLARSGLGWCLAAGLPLASEAVLVSFSANSGFVRFLNRIMGMDSDRLPTLGVLAGNPHSPGQRLILLLFNTAGHPTAVVKAGQAEKARELIVKKKRFLESVTQSSLGMPKLRDVFADEQRSAIALDYFPGRTPRLDEEHALPAILSSWIQSDRTIPIPATSAWQELEKVCAAHPLFASLADALKDRPVRPTLLHGDLTPWNVRVSPAGDWMVIDWERGDANGLPGWDWFHYVIQTRILVTREPVGQLVARLKTLWRSPEFKAYVDQSRIAGAELELTLAYLLHQYEVVRPSEGLAPGSELLQALAAIWKK